MSDPRWSKARKLALEVFWLNDGQARRSNVTALDAGVVYWQSVAWLEEQGFIRYRSGRTFERYELTEAGWEAGARLWMVPTATVAAMRARAAGA